MRRIPPVPEPTGQLYCFKCEQLLPVADFHHLHGKPRRPCKACTKAGRGTQARLMEAMLEAQAEVRAIFATLPPPPPPIERVYAPMDGMARWLAKHEAMKGTKRRRKGPSVFSQKSEAA